MDEVLENLYQSEWTGGDCAQARQAFRAGVEGTIRNLAQAYADQPATYEEAQSSSQHEQRIWNLLSLGLNMPPLTGEVPE